MGRELESVQVLRLRERIAKLGGILTEIAIIVQELTPVGKVKHVGLLEAAAGVREMAAEIERLRKRTHEIQEAADRGNADLHSAVERHKADMQWAHEQLGEFRSRKQIACESQFDELCVLNLRDEWGVKLATKDDEIERLRAELLTLRNAIRLCIGRQNGRAWTTVTDDDVDSYIHGIDRFQTKVAAAVKDEE